MINPNIHKAVMVQVQWDGVTALYKGNLLDIVERYAPAPKPGRRRLYLKYSIISDQFYLSTT